MFRLKLLVLKSISRVFRFFGRGSSIIGMLDRKLHFNIIKEINFEGKPIVFVMGTNGKTTTTNLITSIIGDNHKVITNHEGANLITGIATTLINATKYNKTIDGDFIVLEVDENTIDAIVQVIKPDRILITNFFRDQLDRYGEIDMIINNIIEVINTTDAIVHLNGNDPLTVYRFEKCLNQKQFYGIDQHSKVTFDQSKIIEIKYCPHCLQLLNYNFYHYGHIGNYECLNCDFKQNALTDIMKIDFANHIIQINDDKKIDIECESFPIYYYFNIISAISIIRSFGISYEDALIDNFKNFKFPKGRNQHIKVADKDVYFNLAKNVVGMEETIEYVVEHYDMFDLLIGFNDNHADGQDVSWIWDVKFEVMKNHVNRVFITGSRRYDMAIRFEAEGFSNLHIIEDIASGTNTALTQSGEVLCVISNYTPLAVMDQEIRKWVATYDN